MKLLTFLGIKSHPNNRDLQYPLDLVERPDGGYMKRIIGWLHHCFGDTLDGLYHLHLGEPRRYAEHVHESNRDLDITRLWNDEIYVPAEMQRPFAVSFESLEGLDLSRAQEPFQLLVNLRRLFSSLVHLAVKQPGLVESWGDERPLIRGDRDILQATDELIRGFAADQRMTLRGDYRPPYRLE